MSAQPFIDPFAEEEEPLKRDRWDRPLLVPPGGGEKVPYTRASTLSNYLTDPGGLHTWDQRNIVIGMGRKEDLCGLAAALPPLHKAKRGKTTLTREEKRFDKDVNKQIDEIIAMAKEAADGNYLSRSGTTVHAFCEPGAELSVVPERMVSDVESFNARLAAEGMVIHATEQFVCNDELTVAGTFDHIVWHPKYGFCILDIKTGSIDGKGLAFAVQFSSYARSVIYDPWTDTRIPLESLTGGEAVNTEIGFLAHVPLGEGRTDLYRVNLKGGIEEARKAAGVRSSRQRKDLMDTAPLPTGLPS